MAGEPYTDDDLHQYRRTPSHPHHSPDPNRSSGHENRRRAQVLSDQRFYHTNILYPSFEGYVATKTETHVVHRSHQTTLPHHSLPDILVAGKRHISETDPRDIIQVFSNAKLRIPLSNIRDGEYPPLTEVYELPASTAHPEHLILSKADPEPYKTSSPAVPFRDKSTRSSFMLEFSHLAPYITSTTPVADPAPQAQDINGFAYLGGYINTGRTRQPINLPYHFPEEENLGYVSKFIDPSHALPSLLPSSPRSHRSSISSPSPESSTCTALPSVSPPPIPSADSPAMAAFMLDPTAAPTLPPKPAEYRNLRAKHLAPIPITRIYFSESYGVNQDLRIFSIENSLPPLPPKPEQYRRGTGQSRITYEACGEVKCDPSVSQRLQSGPGRGNRGCGGEREVLRVVNGDV